MEDSDGRSITCKGSAATSIPPPLLRPYQEEADKNEEELSQTGATTTTIATSTTATTATIASTNSWFRVVVVVVAMRPEILLLVLITFVFSLGISGSVGVVPDTIADRYARLHHGYTGPACDSLLATNKPEACEAGSDDAQAAATWSNVGLSFWGLVLNPVVASISDVHGRRFAILASLSVNFFSSALFLCTIVSPTMDPMWYYISLSLTGAFQYLGLAFAALSDLVVEEEYRAGSFGLLLAVMYGGFGFAPSIPLFLSHLQTAWVCTVLLFLILIVAYALLPETLSSEIRLLNRIQEQQALERTTSSTNMSRKFFCGGFSCTELEIPNLSILNRNWTIRLVAIGALISSMVYTCDTTFVLFYIEDRLNFGDADIASLFLLIGVFGVILQGTAVQPLVTFLGENNLLVLTFACGAVHNLLYFLAKSKRLIYVAIILSQLTKVNYPVLASLGSQVVPATEQGRIQGAISACISLGTAAGPVSAELVYGWTKHLHLWGYGGPGVRFLYASTLYIVGAGLMTLIPRKQSSNDRTTTEASATTNEETTSSSHVTAARLGGCDDLEEPLLSGW